MRSSTVVIVNVIYLCVCLLPHAFGQIYSDRCDTPKNREGRCILLPKCPAIVDILKKKPLSREDTEYLRNSGCGFEGSEPKVCCPVSTTATTTRPDVAQEVYTTPPGGYESDLLPSINDCGPNSATRIVGGEKVDLGEFPWMALLEYQTRSGKGFYCGGALISSRYVLTAAHCIKGKDLPTTWRLISVRLGEYNTTSEKDCVKVAGGQQCSLDPVDIPIESQMAHEDYDPYDTNQYNDIGLLRLAFSAPRTSFIAPVCLPRKEFLPTSFEGNNMIVAGWGKTESKSSSDVMLKLRLNIKDNTECGSTYRSVRVKIGDGQLCAGGLRGQDSCRGDSGGPLTKAIAVNESVNYYVLGIVSFGPSPCGMEGWPGVYTRVIKYVPWIISKVKP